MTQQPPTSARRTVSLSLTLAGRTTRTELASYILAAVFLTVLVSFLTAFFVPYDLRLVLRNALTVILAIPVPALLVRRLHDQGRSGVLVWLAVIGFSVWVVRTAISITLGTEFRIGFDRWTWLIDWLVTLTNIAAVIYAILPGTAGPNRFGPDPRQRLEPAVQDSTDRLDPLA